MCRIKSNQKIKGGKIMDENFENKVEEAKQEAVKTYNEAKEQMKNVDFKEEVKKGKGLIERLWKKPAETIKESAEDNENKTFKTALFLIVIWMFVAAVDYILTNSSFKLLRVLKDVLEPALRILAMTISFCIVNNRAKDSLSKVLTSVSIADAPEVLSSLLWILRNISLNITAILSPVSGLLSAISIILMYQTIKALSQEQDDAKGIKTFIKVQVVFYVIAFILRFLGIYI